MQDFPYLFDSFRNPIISSQKSTATEPFFLIGVSDSERGFIITTDKNGKPEDFDFRYYKGVTFQLLRAIASAKADNDGEIDWEQSGSAVYLDEYPHILPLLIKEQHIIDKELKPIRYEDSRLQVTMTVNVTGNQLLFHSVLHRNGSLNKEGDIVNFHLLNDSYALYDNTLVEIEPIGENYSRLRIFNTLIELEQAEMLLSILLSNFTNIAIDFAGKKAHYTASPLTSEPAIFIDKVDADNALYLHVVNNIDGLDTDFVKDFTPTRIATFGGTDQIIIRDVEYKDANEGITDLKRAISSYAVKKTDAKEIFEKEGFFIIPSHVAEPFLLNGFAEISSRFKIHGIDNLKKYHIRPTSPSLKLTLSSGIDFLEGDGAVEVEGELFTFKNFLSQYDKNKYIRLSDGDKAIVNEEYVNRLKRLLTKSSGTGKIKLSFFDLPEIEKLLNEIPDHKAFVRSREFYTGFNSLKKVPLKKSIFKATLRPYQEDGLKWIKYLHDNKMGGCLADDMGLGKTVQTIAMLTTIYPECSKPSLLIMPKSLLFNWETELHRFAPSLEVTTYYGAGRDIEASMTKQVILTTYAIVRNDIEKLSRLDFHYIILDESQNIKSLSAQISRSVFLLKCDSRLALSGTPVENNLLELYSLFHFLNPSMFGSQENFNRKYAIPIHKNDDRDALEELRRKIFPFMLRRCKNDVLTDLPERTDQTIYVEMEPAHTSYYEQRRIKFREQVQQSISKEGLAKSQFVMLQALSELRRIASIPESLSDGVIKSSKIPLIVETVSEAVLNGHKVVVFFNFIAGIEITGEMLDSIGIDYAVMTGNTRDRESVVNRFQNSEDCKVLLMTLKTGGVGLNLTAADTVIIAEPWWNKAAEEQAISRLHRIGQKVIVLSISMITRGTIEEKIRLLQERKADILESLVSTDSGGAKVLTEEDIDFILG